MYEDYKITEHVKKRYAERIMNKEDKYDINLFIVEQAEKIHKDIMHMLEFGDVLFEGKAVCENNNRNTIVIINGLWIIILDPKLKTIVTMYKIDLGLDDEFNNMFVQKALNKLDKAKAAKAAIEQEIQTQVQNYQDIIAENENLINQYKGYLKNLEASNTGYQEAINNIRVRNDIAGKNITDVIAKMIGKKEF